MGKSLMRVGTFGISLILAMSVMVVAGSTAYAAHVLPVNLGTAAPFAILAGTPNITNVSPSVISGNVGLSPATGAGIGLTCSQVTGTIYSVDAAGPLPCRVTDPGLLTTAKNALTTAIGDAAGRTGGLPVAANQLAGKTLTHGVYNSGAAMNLSVGGTLILDGGGDPNAVFIFQLGTLLTVDNGSTVSLINQAQSCNVYWQVDSATIGTTATFRGTILATTSITVANGSTIDGRLLASNGNVTLISDTIRTPTCGAEGGPTDTTPPICEPTSVLSGPARLKITVRDTGSGLASVIVSTQVNASVSIPPFSTGTAGALVVTATKLNPSLASQVGLTVTDVAGNQTICDPVMTTIVRSKGHPTTETYENLPRAESKITILSGTPGTDELVFVVNGKRFKVDDLNDGLTTTIDVASAMKPGNNNTIVIKAHGDRGASVTIVIHD